MGTFKFWPWEFGEKPYFTNDEGFEYYIDKLLTKQCNKEVAQGWPKLDAVCFIVAKNNKAITRMLIDKKTNKVIHEDTTIEGLSTKIDMLRFANS